MIMLVFPEARTRSDLAKAYERVDPLATLPVHLRLVEHELETADARNYRFAARRLARMRKVTRGTEHAEEVDALIADLHETHRRGPDCSRSSPAPASHNQGHGQYARPPPQPAFTRRLQPAARRRRRTTKLLVVDVLRDVSQRSPSGAATVTSSSAKPRPPTGQDTGDRRARLAGVVERRRRDHRERADARVMSWQRPGA